MQETGFESVVDTVANAIQHGKAGFSLLDVCSVVDPSDVFYYECLGRIIGSGGEVLTADKFIPMLEAGGRAAEFDRYILELSFDWLAQRPTGLLGCNVSAENLIDVNSWSLFHEILVRNRTLASRLVLEITESLPMTALEQASELLQSVRSLGCRIAIDDFGTGYATVERLVSMPIDVVKIDAMFSRRKDREVTENFLAHLVGLASCVAPIVVVEGIETQAQLEAAAAAGASHVQGYLFCMPALMPTYWGSGSPQ